MQLFSPSLLCRRSLHPREKLHWLYACARPCPAPCAHMIRHRHTHLDLGACVCLQVVDGICDVFILPCSKFKNGVSVQLMNSYKRGLPPLGVRHCANVVPSHRPRMHYSVCGCAGCTDARDYEKQPAHRIMFHTVSGGCNRARSHHRAPRTCVCLNPVMTQGSWGQALGLGFAGAIVRSINAAGARIRVTGAIRVRDTVKLGLTSI